MIDKWYRYLGWITVELIEKEMGRCSASAETAK